MAWALGTPLVATLAELESLAGRQNLANLEVGGTAAVANALASASDQLYWKVKKGQDPAKLSNSAAYKPAVAWHALAILVMNGSLSVPEGRESPASPFEWSTPFLDEVGPEVTEGDTLGRLGRPIPRIKNVNTGRF